MRILTTCVAAFLTVTLTVSAGVLAEGPNDAPAPPGSSNAGSGTITATAGSSKNVGTTPTTQPTSGGGSEPSAPQRCQWIATPETQQINGILYRHHLRLCVDSDGLERALSDSWFAEVSPRQLANSAWQQVVAKVPKPAFGSAPPSHNAIVKFDMWLWTDPAQFVPVTAQASVPTLAGRITATVTAEPIRLVFDPGEPDSEKIICAGPGQAWDPSFGDLADSACLYAYRHSSEITDTDTFTATWSTVWRVTWTSSSGAGGTLDEAFVTTTQQPMIVKEVQTIIVE